MSVYSLQDLFESDTQGLLDSDIEVYKGYTIRKIGNIYELRSPEGWLQLQTSNTGTAQQCRDAVESALRWKREAK